MRIVAIGKKIVYLFKRHFYNQIMTGDFKKIIHLLINSFNSKFFEYPRLAIIETGTTCNLKCPTCPTPRNALGRRIGLMEFDDFKKIIDNIKKYIHVALLYNSNEPLLHPRLAEMIEYSGNQGLYTMISTNVMLLTKEKTSELLNSGLDEILLCLDGTTKDTYEDFRGPGSNFETVIENIKFFCAEKKRRGLLKPYTELQFISNKLNQNQIPEIKKFAKEVGVDRLRIKSMGIGKYAYQGEERERLMKKYVPTKVGIKSRFKNENKNKEIDCDLPRIHATILVNGDLAMCCYDIKGEYVLGNVLKTPFSKIWFDLSRNERNRGAKRDLPLCKICGNCF